MLGSTNESPNTPTRHDKQNGPEDSANHASDIKQVFNIESRFVGLIIGKEAKTIRALKEQTGVRVFIDKANDTTDQLPRQVTISGSPNGVKDCAARIKQMISNVRDDPRERKYRKDSMNDGRKQHGSLTVAKSPSGSIMSDLGAGTGLPFDPDREHEPVNSGPLKPFFRENTPVSHESTLDFADDDDDVGSFPPGSLEALKSALLDLMGDELVDMRDIATNSEVVTAWESARCIGLHSFFKFFPDDFQLVTSSSGKNRFGRSKVK